MYTIDSMIERLIDLKSVAPDGGNTPIVVNSVGPFGFMENVFLVELIPVVVKCANKGNLYQTIDDNNTHLVVKVFNE